MSPDFDGLVQTSTSMGEAATEGATLRVHHLSRSSNASAEPDIVGALDAVARLAGGELTIDQHDPGWRPDLGSAALASLRQVYERLFGEPPAVTAVHAWLETAVIGERVGGLDMVSFGPQIEAPHSPDERISIPTVERFWRLLLGVVDELSAA
jgi:dipeptidase D